MSAEIRIRETTVADREWIVALLTEAWTSPQIGSRGRMHDASALPGLIGELDGRRAGLLTYHIEGAGCEIVSLNCPIEGRGVGSALIAEARRIAAAAGCRRLWLITSNDNLPALRFYQKRGFRLIAVHEGAIDALRQRKPQIPEIGLDGIPLRDELELEAHLDR